MAATLRRSAAVLAALALFVGTWWLDGTVYGLSRPYAVILIASAVLIAMRQLGGDVGAVPRAGAPRRYWLYAAALAIAAVVGSVWLTLPAYAPRPFTGPEQLELWIAIGLSAVLAAHFCDRRRLRTSQVAFDRSDWAIMAALVALGTVARLWNLNRTPPSLAYDEAWPFARTLQLLMQGNRPPFHVDDFAMSATYHYLSGASITLFSWTGLDTLQAAKLPNVVFGGLSIGVLYAALRLVASRRIAVVAGLCLVWLTWPWILSRMHYSYSGDLLWVGLATALVMAAFASDRMAFAAAGAIAAALGVAWVKSAVLAAPWVLLLCAERFIARRDWRRPRALAVPAACAFTLALTVAPIAAQLYAQPDFLWRYRDVLQQRAAILEQNHLSSLDGYVGGLIGAFTVLQAHEAPLGRHIARLKFPALDPITSALGTLGFCWAVWRWRREWGARVALLGFFVFLWPAVSSYPTEAGPAVSRRMIGSAFFICWLAGYGADVVTRVTLPARRRLPAMLALGAAAMILNLYYLRTAYDTRLFHLAEEIGVNRAAIIRALREAAPTGPVFFRPTTTTEASLAGTVDLPYVIPVGTVDDLRQQLARYPGRLCTVVLPSDTLAEGTDVQTWIAALADVIPTSSWEFGDKDPAGTPYFRRAVVRVPVAPPVAPPVPAAPAAPPVPAAPTAP